MVRSSCAALGECRVCQREFDEAEQLLLESREWSERTFPEGYPEHARILLSLKLLYARWGKAEEAARYAELLKERNG